MLAKEVRLQCGTNYWDYGPSPSVSQIASNMNHRVIPPVQVPPRPPREIFENPIVVSRIEEETEERLDFGDLCASIGGCHACFILMMKHRPSVLHFQLACLTHAITYYLAR